MTTLLKIAIGTLLSLTSATVASAAGDVESSTPYSVVLVSRTITPQCRDQDAERELNVCHNAKGCYKRDLNLAQGVTFKLPTAGSFSLLVKGPLADARIAFQTGDDIPERLTQVLNGYGDCKMTFTYRITR